MTELTNQLGRITLCLKIDYHWYDYKPMIGRQETLLGTQSDGLRRITQIAQTAIITFFVDSMLLPSFYSTNTLR
jgi:hypothetical protein